MYMYILYIYRGRGGGGGGRGRHVSRAIAVAHDVSLEQQPPATAITDFVQFASSYAERARVLVDFTALSHGIYVCRHMYVSKGTYHRIFLSSIMDRVSRPFSSVSAPRPILRFSRSLASCGSLSLKPRTRRFLVRFT